MYGGMECQVAVAILKWVRSASDLDPARPHHFLSIDIISSNFGSSSCSRDYSGLQFPLLLWFLQKPSNLPYLTSPPLSHLRGITHHSHTKAQPPMPTILITGAASGLGAAFVEAYRTQPSTKILALDISPIKATRPNIHPYTLDLTSEQAVLSLVAHLSNQPIDLIIHSAGIRGLVPTLETQHPNNVAACETLAGMDLETITRTFQINTVATFSLLRALLPNLQKAPQPKVIVMSSRMGSLANNALPNATAGSAYAYRASKAALNMIVRSFAVDVPGVLWVLCHPGRVETGLVKGKEEGAIQPGESVEGIVLLIEKWDKSNSGMYYDRFGKVIPW